MRHFGKRRFKKPIRRFRRRIQRRVKYPVFRMRDNKKAVILRSLNSPFPEYFENVMTQDLVAWAPANNYAVTGTFQCNATIYPYRPLALLTRSFHSQLTVASAGMLQTNLTGFNNLIYNPTTGGGLYYDYVPISFEFELALIPNSISDQGQLVVALMNTSDTLVAQDPANHMKLGQMPHAKTAYTADNTSPEKIVIKGDVAKLNGVSRSVLFTDPTYRGQYATLPTRGAVIQASNQISQAATNTNTIVWCGKIRIHGRFMNPSVYRMLQ